MVITLSLTIIGTGEDPRWAAHVQPRRGGGQNCCETGHRTPEEAATHGSTLAAAWLAHDARSLQSPAYGREVIQQLEAV